jgi:hypothetical protein
MIGSAGHTRPRAAREEHGKSPLVDDPRLPAFTIKPRASAIDSHLVRAPSDSRPFWRQPTPLDTAEHRNMRRCRRCDRANWLEPDPKAMGLPVLRALSLCTCCRHYPGAADGRSLRSCHPSVSAFPDSTFGSACTSSLLSVYSRCGLHTRTVTVCRDRYPKASDTSSPPCLPRLLPAGAIAGWVLHPLEKRRLVTAHVESRHSHGISGPGAWLRAILDNL